MRGWSSFRAATPRRHSAIRSRCSLSSRGFSPSEAGESPEAERVLATVLFTDIVGATAIAAEFGDQRWRELLTAHCEVVHGKVGGLAVHIGARVAARAEAREVLVSSTVKDLVAGSGIAFNDRGTHELMGVPGEWHLYSIAR